MHTFLLSDSHTESAGIANQEATSNIALWVLKWSQLGSWATWLLIWNHVATGWLIMWASLIRSS